MIAVWRQASLPDVEGGILAARIEQANLLSQYAVESRVVAAA